MLNTNELAALRTDILATLPDTCTIQRASITTNSAGHSAQTWAASSSGVACRIDPYQRQDSTGMVGQQEKQRAWYRLTVPYDTDLQDGDRIIYSSDTYEVIQLHDDHSLRAVRRAVIAKLG